MEKWPNFFIVGAAKAGTSSLHEYLKKIPGIYMSTPKEPNFFTDDVTNIVQISDKKKYLDLFKDVTNEKAVGESSTTYLKGADPKKIKNIIPHAKIIISLRDPVEQVHSTYLYWKRSGITKQTFHEQIKEIWKDYQEKKSIGWWGFYDPVKGYLDTFDEKHIKIIIFEEWIRNPKKIIEELLRFLEVEQNSLSVDNRIHNKFPDYIPRNKISRKILHNKKINQIALKFPVSIRWIIKHKVLRRKQSKPQISKEDRKILIESYREDVQKLEKVLGRTLPWPNFHN